MIGLVAATGNGRALAAHVEAAWPEARRFDGRAREALAAAWSSCDAVVAFLATGIAMRLVAPLLADKRRDPGLVCVDDAGRYAVALCGGHDGGANALARRLGALLGATPVVTTATDTLDLPALDGLGTELGFRIVPGSDLAAVAAALVAGEAVTLTSDQRWPLGPLANVAVAPVPSPPCLIVSDQLVEPPRPAVVYRPPSLVVGVGCSRGAPADEILALVDGALAEAGLAAESVAELASVSLKADEPGLLEAAAERGWPLRFHEPAALAALEVPNPSEIVARAVGTPSVAEAAALAGGRAELVLPKRKGAHATVAIARRAPKGRLALVGLGPGDLALVPELARQALAHAELVVGLDRYVEQARPLLRPGTRVDASSIGSELTRAERALAEARTGGSVALVSGGDVGVYAMASPALEAAGDDVDITIVPGVTAAQAAAALLGAPLGHDHCAISLSDLLTPWPLIRRRVELAAEADFVVSFYNPRSRGRDWQLGEAREILLAHRPPQTPVGVVADAFRPEQRVALTTLAALDPSEVAMTTTVVVGSSQTRVVAGRMVTPRGYA